MNRSVDMVKLLQILNLPPETSDAEAICHARRVLRERGVDVRYYHEGDHRWGYFNPADVKGKTVWPMWDSEAECIAAALRGGAK